VTNDIAAIVDLDVSFEDRVLLVAGALGVGVRVDAEGWHLKLVTETVSAPSSESLVCLLAARERARWSV
jgi:hypothetical protein